MTQKPGYAKRLDPTIGKETAAVIASSIGHAGVEHFTQAWVDKFSPDQVEYATKYINEMFPLLTPNGQRKLREPTFADFKALGMAPEDGQVYVEGNLITTDGLGRLTNFLIGTGSLVGFTATTTRIGVGDSTTAATAADTDLGASAGSTHRWFQIADSAPTRVTTTVTNDAVQAVATFGTSDGNFAWQEWAFNLGTATPTSSATVDASAGKCFFNHKIASFGTKASGASWAFTAKVTFS
jgi:hypothetical protein